MLWLAVHLPLLSLEAFCATLVPGHTRAQAAGHGGKQRHQPGAPGTDQREPPVALVAEHRVQAVNRAAAEQGVRAGLKRPTALALCADLLLAEADATRDAAALQAVVHAALAFTPAVTTQDGNTVLLDVQPSLRLFGGLAPLRQRLADALKPLGHRLQMAAAPTALGAALLAQWHPSQRQQQQDAAHPKPRADPQASPPAQAQAQAQAQGSGQEQEHEQAQAQKQTQGQAPRQAQKPGQGDLVLGPHATHLRALQHLLEQGPVWLLGPGRVHWDSLQGMGLQTLADLRHLPRSGLARRIGTDVLDDLDRAFGLQPDPRDSIALPPVFDSRLELFARAETTDQVLHGAAVLLARLVAWAQARHARVAAFTLCMLHERQRHASIPPTELRVELAEPALAASHLQLLLRERLARIELAAPTLELRLHCSEILAGHAPNAELFPTRASESQGMTRLLERLRARLGDAQVQRLVAVADHRPERATQSVPVAVLPGVACEPAFQTAASPAPGSQAPGNPELPLHRPAWLIDPLPLSERDALPLLQGRPLQLLSGPERIESGWWDGHLVARDYYIAQADSGALVWVFRNRLPDLAGETPWFLQGRFG